MGSLIYESRDASGLHYRRNRYYDSESGRFTQEDPIGLAGGVNVYGFAYGDPVSYSDPYGLCPPEDDVDDCATQYWADRAEHSGSRAGRAANRVMQGLAACGESNCQIGLDIVSLGGELGIKAAGRGIEALGEILVRRGTSYESAARLGRKAAEAEASRIGIHGVSVTAGEAEGAVSRASRETVERSFKVHNTRTAADPLHRTVELPKPVTREVADLFNKIFGRSR